MLITIDPTNASTIQQNLLHTLLTSMGKRSILKAKTRYDFYILDIKTQQTIKLKIKLTHNILRCTNEKNPDQYQFVVFKASKTTRIGKSSNSKIYKVNKIIECNEKALNYINAKKIVKLVNIDNEQKHTRVYEEYKTSSKAVHLQINKPIVVNNDGYQTDMLFSKSYTVMRRFKGKNLLKILKNDRNNKLKLTFEQRLILIIQLFKKLKQQVHAKNLLHRDIKSENIIVDLRDPNKPKVNIIDFDLSREKITTDSKDTVGSPGYAAPECFEGTGMDESSDNYSMARIAGLLLGAKMQNIQAKNQHQKTINYDFEGIFTGISDEVSTTHQEKIKAMLRKINSAKQSARPGTDEIIVFFQSILNEIKHEKLSASTKESSARKTKFPFSIHCNFFKRNKILSDSSHAIAPEAKQPELKII